MSYSADEYNLRRLFRALEWLAIFIVAASQALWALAVVTFDPLVQTSFILLGVTAVLSAFLPRTMKWWYIQLASQIILVSLAEALGARQYYYVIVYVLAAKAALVLPLRRLLWFGCALALLHIISSQYAIYALHNQHPGHHKMPGYYRQLVLEPEADLYFVMGMLTVTYLGRSLVNERQNQAREKTLAAEIQVMAVELERDRIARDIHDGLGHSLNASKIQLERADRMLQDNQTDGVLELLTRSHQATRSALLEVRRAARTTLNEQFNLRKAIVALAEQISEDDPLGIEVELDEIVLSQRVQHQLYYIVQECLTNVRKHAQADRVVISLKKDGVSAVLTVRDNGKGFDLGAQNEGYGRKGSGERATSIGATIECKSSIGCGTDVIVRFPLADRQPAETC